MAEEYRPTDARELRDLIAWAAGAEEALEIAGASSKRGLGRPVEAARLVRLDGMRGIDLYEPEELVMAAGVGTPLAAIEARLAENRQQLAFEPPDLGPLFGAAPDGGTIGGAIACNLAGPRRIRAGAARDHFLGTQAVTGRGDVVRTGGRVMKNVTGYDLCKLLAGSYGTLAAMTEVTFKVLPAADETLTLLIGGGDGNALFGALRVAVGSAYDVSGAAIVPAAVAARSAVAEVAGADCDLAAIRLEGPGPSVRYRADALKPLVASEDAEVGELASAASLALWREVRDVAWLRDGPGALWRVSVAPADGPKVVAGLEADMAVEWFADWAGGLLWIATAADGDAGAAAIREAIAGYGGHATLIRGGPELRGRIEVFQPQPEPLARLTARVKDSFDPGRVLNRGRMYAGL